MLLKGNTFVCHKCDNVLGDPRMNHNGPMEKSFIAATIQCDGETIKAYLWMQH